MDVELNVVLLVSVKLW